MEVANDNLDFTSNLASREKRKICCCVHEGINKLSSGLKKFFYCIKALFSVSSSFKLISGDEEKTNADFFLLLLLIVVVVGKKRAEKRNVLLLLSSSAFSSSSVGLESSEKNERR